MNDYEKFIEGKSQGGINSGFDPVYLPDFLFDFQKSLVEWSIRKGRSAIFADCGLGKTPMQLVWAENIVRKTNKPTLIITPLAVAAQHIREGEKFGIECHRSSDGSPKPNITITNYEQLHKFNPDDFGGAVCDECFAPDTLVEIFDNGVVYSKEIRYIQVNEKIINATGVDTVAECHRRKVNRAYAFTFNGRRVIASENHPWLTQRGWVPSRSIRETDWLLETTEAMRILRGDVCSENSSECEREILREIMLSEMADEPTGTLSESSHEGNTCKDRQESFALVENYQGGAKECSAIRCLEADAQSGNKGTGEPSIESHEPQTFRAWRKREGHDSAAIATLGGVTEWMGERVCLITWGKNSRLSDLLQAGFGRTESQDCDRSRRALPSFKEGTGCEKGCKAGFFRVESIEVLERGHPDLECFADPKGDIYFYDIGLTRHPSFTVNGVLVHNSSILKSFKGVHKQEITVFMRKMNYRLLATATAAPNDYVELGTSSEALGYMGHMDMLGKFFKNDQNTSAAGGGGHGIGGKRFGDQTKWRFKGHAELPFWKWVCSWARAVRKPSDLGFDDSKFVLPPLYERQHLVNVKNLADGMLFALPAHGLQEQRDERRRSINERCEKVAELVKGNKPALVWCHLNPEGDLLERLIPGAVQVSGDDCDEVKEERLMGFEDGKIRVLVTKPKIAGWGLNFQQCSHVTFFPSHSYEQYYQGVRRCWRFGQKNAVTVDVVTTDGELNVLRNLQRKAGQADRMFSNLVAEMNNALHIAKTETNKTKEKIPSWLKIK